MDTVGVRELKTHLIRPSSASDPVATPVVAGCGASTEAIQDARIAPTSGSLAAIGSAEMPEMSGWVGTVGWFGAVGYGARGETRAEG